MDSSNELLAELLERTGSSAESVSGSEDHNFFNLADIGSISPSEHESESSLAPSESSICDKEEERRLSQLMDRRNIHSDATDSPGSSTDSATNIRLSRLKGNGYTAPVAVVRHQDPTENKYQESSSPHTSLPMIPWPIEIVKARNFST